jgi:hypothetical protein
MHFHVAKMPSFDQAILQGALTCFPTHPKMSGKAGPAL